jgi:acetyl-CoA carboxylase biotin carboxyl carrier protein
MGLDNVKELVQLLKDNDLSELYVKQGELEFRARRGERKEQTYIMQSTPALVQPAVGSPSASGFLPAIPAPPPPAPEPPAPVKKEETPARNLKEICSPIVGTFYRSSSPDAPPYVEIGDVVNQGTLVCIVEAMKVMNEIKAEMKGRVRKILVENATPVEYGQPLFLVEPN